MRYAGIAFDIDGTLLDTIPFWQEAYLATLHAYGIDMHADDFLQKIYCNNTEFAEVMKSYGLPEEDTHICREKRDDLYCGLLRAHNSWFPGAKQCIEHLSKEFRITAMTGSWRTYMDAINEASNLYSLLPHIITHDDANERSKPDPYGIQLACACINLQPKECVYVGDQLFDMEAAENAHMDGILIVRDTTPPAAKDKATYVVESFEELCEIVF